MPFHTAKDHRGRTVPIIGAGWRLLWPFDREIRAGEGSEAYRRAASAIPGDLRWRLFTWCVAINLFVFFALYLLWKYYARPTGFGTGPTPQLFFLLPGLFGGGYLFHEVKGATAGIIEASLKAHACPSCGYDMTGLVDDPDGYRVCPECGAAWRISNS